MRKMIKLMIIICFVLLYSVPSYALTIDEIDISWNEPRMFTVKGKNDSGNEGEYISIEIINPEKTMEDFTIRKQGQAYFANMGQTKTDKNGDFEYSFCIEKATNKSGYFTLRIKNSNENTVVEEIPFGYSSSEKVEESLSKIDDYINKNDKDIGAINLLSPLLDNDIKLVYLVSAPLYEKLCDLPGDNDEDSYSNAQEDVAEALTYMKADSVDGKTMSEMIKRAVVVSAYKNGIITVDEIMKEYADVLKISETEEYEYYNDFVTEYSEKFNTTFKKINTDNLLVAENYINSFQQAVVITDFSISNGIGDIDEKIGKYDSYFDLSVYNNTKSSNEKKETRKLILKLFENNTDVTLVDIQNVLDKSIPSGGGSNAGSGGSSGGGSSRPSSGGSSSSVGMSAVILPQLPEEKLQEVVPTTQNSSFVDIEDYDWAKTEIEYLAMTGVVSGKAEGVFAPGDNLTRAETCKLVCNLFSISDKEYNVSFADVGDGDWYAQSVKNVAFLNIVTGKDQTYFGATESITRQDFVVILLRTLNQFSEEIFNTENELDFSDIEDISEYAVEAVSNFCELGIVNGFEDGTFRPLNNITRAEAAKILYKTKMIYEGRE